MVNTFMLVISIWSYGGARQDIALSFDLTYADCVDMAYYVERGLNDSAEVYCEIQGVY